MFKRLTAILITLAMLFGMCAVVTADTIDPYEYLPRDITIVTYSGNDGAVVAWKNPTSDTLKKVTVTDTGNDAVLGTIENPTPGGISRVSSGTASVQYGKLKVKFLFEFSNGEKRVFYYTQDKRNYSLNAEYSSGKVAVTNLNDYNVFTTNEENSTAGGKNSLKIVSNINPEVNNSTAQIFFNNKATGGGGKFTVMGALKSNTTYNFEYKIKTDTALSLSNYINSAGGAMLGDSGTATVQPSADWQTVSGSFKMPEEINAYMFFAIGLKQATNSPIYIDDLKITELDTDGKEYTEADTTTHTIDFEDLNKTMAKPTNVTASASDGMATIGWSADTSVGRYINVYEVINEKKILISRLDLNKDSSVDIENLKNGKTYKFAVSAMTFEGIESDVQEIDVTPQKSRLSKYKYEPGNLMITGWRNGVSGISNAHQGYAISWINPMAEMTSIKLYEITSDGSEVEKVPNRVFEPKYMRNAPTTNIDLTTPGAVVRYENQGLTESSGTATYRIVFNFADGTVRDIIYSGAWNGSTGDQLVDLTGKIISVYPGFELGSVSMKNSSDGADRGKYSLSGPNGVKISAKQTKGSAPFSLELTSNQLENSSGKQLIINMGQDMTQNESYNFSMDINTLQAAKIQVGKTDVDIPNTNGEWQTISGKFNSTYGDKRMYIAALMATRDIYIDNIRVYSDDNSIDTTYSFADVTQDCPDKMTGVSATQGEKDSTTISWETASTQFVNVYEDIDEDETDNVHTWMLRARVPSDENSAKSVTLKNLESDATHNFMCTTERFTGAFYGLESEGTECSATTVMPDYEIDDVKLLAEGEEVQNFIPGGTYTAQAKVTNQKITDGIKAQVIVAVYADGVLESCTVSDAATVAIGENQIFNVPSFSIGNEDKTYTAKIMVWKGLDSVTPLLKNSVSYTTAD